MRYEVSTAGLTSSSRSSIGSVVAEQYEEGKADCSTTHLRGAVVRPKVSRRSAWYKILNLPSIHLDGSAFAATPTATGRLTISSLILSSPVVCTVSQRRAGKLGETDP